MKHKIIHSLLLAIIISGLFSCGQNNSSTNAKVDTSTVLNRQKNTAKIESLDTNLYEIVKVTKNRLVTNYYVLIKFSHFNKDTIIDFMKKFKSEFGYKTSNVDLFDSRKALTLVDKEPLEGKEYVYVADHYIAMSIFDEDPNDLSYYPFQDYNYKDYGGKNWKVIPVK